MTHPATAPTNPLELKPRRTFHPAAITAGAIAIVFALNTYIARLLFRVDFTRQTASIESSYISISRWALDHWHDWRWFPLWFTGSPFNRVYQPGLHLTVARLAHMLHWTPEHSYHVLTGLAYAATPVALFWLCYQLSGRKGYAFLAAVLYSLFSAMAVLYPAVARDLGSPLLLRRYQVLVQYGEGPHTTAMAMLPLVIWLLDRAIFAKRWYYVALAPPAVTAVVITNWPGTMGLAMAASAYALAILGPGWPRRWATLGAIAAVAYLLVIPWASPSILRLVIGNAQASDGTSFDLHRLFIVGLLAALLAAAHLVFERAGAGRGIRLVFNFVLITGFVVLGDAWFNWRLLPQANRFQLEFDMVAAAAAALLLSWTFRRVPRKWQAVALAVALLLGGGVQLRRNSRYAVALTRPIDISSTIEYRMAKWFDANMQGRRVFAPGNVSLWMNMFTDVPEVAGCCDQGIPTLEHRIAVYTVYTGQNTGSHDAAISILWLKAYGAAAIGVTGPNSTEPFKPFWNARKFDGLLPQLWREGDNVVYAVPKPSDSLAHVISKSAVVRHAPEIGLMVEPLEPLVTALDSEKPPFAPLRWLNQHEAAIDAAPGTGDVIFVQETYSPGWHASENDAPLRITPDALGMMVIHPAHPGQTHISLIYDGSAEARWTRCAQLAGFLILAIWSAGVAYSNKLR